MMEGNQIVGQQMSAQLPHNKTQEIRLIRHGQDYLDPCAYLNC